MTFKRAVLVLLAIYVLLFVGRAIYDIATFEEADGNYNIYYSGYDASDKLKMTQNIASFRQEYVTAGGVEVLDQKYEKIASLTAKTIHYDEDEKKLHKAIEECLAVVQMENRTGLEGSRRLNMVIGVKPDYFETAVESINSVGRIISFTTTVSDKTYEYRQMVAEKEKLVRQIESYQAMKERGGSISELLQVEDRIIEVEAQLQMQAVMLGDYSDDNALCTINFTLNEGNEASIWHKLWNAFTWATTTYLGFLGILLLTCGAAFVFLAVWKYGKKVYSEIVQKAAFNEQKKDD
jgi:hypothetical protein